MRRATARTSSAGWHTTTLAVITSDATVPAAFGSWAFALQRFGTLRLADVLEPVLDYAESGFPVYPGLHASLTGLARRFREEWPSTAGVYLPEGRIPEWGDRFRNLDWAAACEQLVAAEEDDEARAAHA